MKERRRFEDLVQIMVRLREECPWDQAQTFETLKHYLIEEAYEVIEAIEEGTPEKIREELGDLLFQIVFQAELARREGDFDIDDVIEGIAGKMIRRHPHVFGDVTVKDAQEVTENWARIKARERQEGTSVLAGVPRKLPALLRAQRLSEKAASTGFDWDRVEEILEKAHEELGELEEAVASGDRTRIEAEIGDLLFVIVNVARFLDMTAEEALHRMLERFIRRFQQIEARLGTRLGEASIEEMEALWEEAKRMEKVMMSIPGDPRKRRGGTLPIDEDSPLRDVASDLVTEKGASVMLLEKMRTHDFEQVVFCQDRNTGLKAIIAVHNTSRGPALGGARCYPYPSEEAAIEDALRLARGMTHKAAMAGLELGGGKAVLLLDPRQKTRDILRAYGRFVDRLNGLYITTEDSGTSVPDMDIVREETRFVVGYSPEKGSSGDPSPFTARGVALGIEATWRYATGEDSIAGRTILLPGCGHVGSHLARRLAEKGANLILSDIFPDRAETLARDLGARTVQPVDAYRTPCDILAPCALGGVINDETIETISCRVIAGAANNQLAEPRHGRMLMEKGILYAPDYVINAGGLIHVADEWFGYQKARVEERIDRIADTLVEIYEESKRSGEPTSEVADRLAEERIVRGILRD